MLTQIMFCLVNGRASFLLDSEAIVQLRNSGRTPHRLLQFGYHSTTCSLRGPTVIHHQRSAGDKAGGGRGEESDRLRDVAGLADPRFPLHRLILMRISAVR